MSYTVLLIFLGVSLPPVTPATDAEKLLALEKRMDVLEPVGMNTRLVTPDTDRIAALERRMESLELLCIARSGMERHCLMPDVLNGVAICPKKMPPGTRCSVKCNAGYLPTPSKDTATCKDDGFWSIEMECEIPLVIISGGLVDQGSGDSSMEVISLYPSQGCDKKLSPMPLIGGANRTLHNLFYLPEYGRILACNGLTDQHLASCDELSLKTNGWMRSSYPHLIRDSLKQICSWSDSSSCNEPNQDKGRYAAQGAVIGGNAYILGGMLYDNDGHDPTTTIRSIREVDKSNINRYSIGDKTDYWTGEMYMEKPRAFFCTAEVEKGLLMIGGLSKDKKKSVVEKSVEYTPKDNIGGGHWVSGGTYKKDSKFLSDMSIPRSGHGCTNVGGNYSILVTGGTQEFGGTALPDAEVYSPDSNSWTSIASMNIGRFGHAVVAVGDKVFAIGGDDRNNNYMDTIEEYDARRNTWTITNQKLKKSRSNFGFTVVPHSIFDGCVIQKPLNE